jgi:mediator of RNA polymerase II transcription subunit 14
MVSAGYAALLFEPKNLIFLDYTVLLYHLHLIKHSTAMSLVPLDAAATDNQGALQQQQQQQQQQRTDNPPPIPHITANIISLSSILRKFSEFSFAELSFILSIQPNDEQKKKKLLELIVHLRKEFVRLYVLLKWSKSSSIEFTKLIDLLSYLREQTQYFTNLIWATQGLNQSLLSAKLPNPDIVTSLEVLNHGVPILPTHNLIKRSELSSGKVLKVLKDLNVLLNIKFAMVDEIPRVFLENYKIKDGRIYIRTKDYNFQLSMLHEKSSFILINFQLNGAEDDEDDQGVENIPHSSKLRRVSNEILKMDNFNELEKVFKNYNNTIKFYLIHLKLNKIKNIKHQYYPEKFLIMLHYWISSFVFKNSYIEIGLNKSNELIYRWFKSGKFVKTFKDVQDIEIFLQDIQFKHSQEILSQINDLSVNNSLLQLNSRTGLFYFKNSTPFLNNSLKKLNLDEFKNINDNMKQLKLSHQFKQLISILTVTNWQVNDSQKLPHSDLRKILIFDRNDIDSLTPAQINNIGKSVKILTRHEWPMNWQLILFIDVNEIRGFIGTFNNSGNGGLEHFKEVKVDSLTYRNSKEFIGGATEEVLIELISSELEGTRFKHEEISGSGGDKKKSVTDDTMDIEINGGEGEKKPDTVKSKVKNGMFLIDTKSFVDVLYCSEVIYLKYEILESLEVKVEIHGKLLKNYQNLNLSELKIDNSKGFLQIEEIFKFNQVGNLKFLNGIKSKLKKLSKILELIDILQTEEGISLISINLNEIIFSYHSSENVIKLKQSSTGIKSIEFNDSNPHKLCQLSIQEYLNRNGISKLVKYLTNTITLFDKFKTISNSSIHQEGGKQLSLEIIPKNVNNFDILYFNSQSGKLIRLMIQIRKIENKDVFKFYLAVECSLEKDQAVFNEVLKFSSNKSNSNNTNGFSKGVVLLNDCVVCGGGEKLESSIDYLNKLILERF